jgi:hypothetical protein
MKVRNDSPSGAMPAEPSFGLGLRLEDGLHNAHTNRSLDAGADIGGLVLFFIKSPDDLHKCLAERGKVSAALRSVLAVDEGIVFLTALGGVREGDLDILADKMDGRIERLVLHFLAQKIQQTILGAEFLAIENDRKSRIEIRIIPAHLLDEGFLVFRLGGENRAVEFECEAGAIGSFVAPRVLHIHGELAFGKLERFGLSIAPGLDLEKVGKRVDRLDADAVEANGFFESLAVVFRAGVDLGGAIEQFPSGMPRPKSRTSTRPCSSISTRTSLP